MFSFRSTVIALCALIASPLFAFGIHCKYTENESRFTRQSGKIVYEASRLPFFALERLLKLKPGFSYGYNRLRVEFDEDDCVQSTVDPTVAYCQTFDAKLTMNRDELSVEKGLLFASVVIEKLRTGRYFTYNVNMTFQTRDEDAPYGKETQSYQAGCQTGQ